VAAAPGETGGGGPLGLNRLGARAVVLVASALALAGCDRGCGALIGRVTVGHGLGTTALGQDLPLGGFDCPDGLARCEQGVISVSRLATIPSPCRGSPEACRCPWDRAADCPGPCAADGVEVVVERSAAAQLCAPQDGPSFVLPSRAPLPSPGPCEEGDRFECSSGSVVECASNSIAGTCLRGCQRDGGAVDDDRVNREAAFAILCSR
jgi:hypothetical protein